MRIAIVSDVHGNRTAFEAVVRDLRETAPDLVLHGGDLADMGSGPIEVIDFIVDSGWPGVFGNTDEMLFRPESLEEYAAGLPHLGPLFGAVREIAAETREALGQARLNWLAQLPLSWAGELMALVHGSFKSTWRACEPGATSQELESTYRDCGEPLVVFGHVHHPFVRETKIGTIANAGSVGLPYDGDPRASYLLVDESVPSIRRVPYETDREIAELSRVRRRHASWIAKMLQTARPHMP